MSVVSPQQEDSARSRPTQRVSFEKQTDWYRPSKSHRMAFFTHHRSKSDPSCDTAAGIRERSTSRTRWWKRIVAGDPDTDDDDDDDKDPDNGRSLTIRLSQWFLFPDSASMPPFKRLLYHLVAFIISLAGLIFFFA